MVKKMKWLSLFKTPSVIMEPKEKIVPIAFSDEEITSLALRYPILRKFITQMVEEKRTQELYDFLHGIELEDSLPLN